MTTPEIIEALKRRGWTVANIARRVGRSASAVHRWRREARIADDETAAALRALLAEPPQRNAKRWRPRRSDLVLACIHAGFTRKEIAERCDVSPTLITQWLSGHSPVARRHEATLRAIAKGTQVQISPDDDTQTIVHGLRARGWTRPQLAARCGVSPRTIWRWGSVTMTGSWDDRAREALLPLLDEEPPIPVEYETPTEVKRKVAAPRGGQCPITLPRPAMPDPEHIARRLRYAMDQAGVSAATVARACVTSSDRIRNLIIDPEDANYRTLARADAWLHRLDAPPDDYWRAYAALADGPGTREEIDRDEVVDVGIARGWIVERRGMLWWAGWEDDA